MARSFAGKKRFLPRSVSIRVKSTEGRENGSLRNCTKSKGNENSWIRFEGFSLGFEGT